MQKLARVVLACMSLIAGTLSACTLTSDHQPEQAGEKSGWCAAQPPHLLCDDFDQTPFGAKWTGKLETGAALSVDSALTVSPPLAMVARGVLASTGPGAIVHKDLPVPTKGLRC